MKLTFKELGIYAAEYTGMTAAAARMNIINTACNYVMNKLINNPTIEEDNAIPWPEDAEVCFVSHKVNLYVNMAYITIH